MSWYWWVLIAAGALLLAVAIAGLAGLDLIAKLTQWSTRGQR